MTVICTDTTGTLTAGEQTVTELRVAGHDVRFMGTGYAPRGEVLVDGERFDANRHAAVRDALSIAALANDASLAEKEGVWTPIGDPTDAALLGPLMQRLYGSDDLFPADRIHACRPWPSIDYVTCHDGFTLYDLVSCDRKTNRANGHANR